MSVIFSVVAIPAQANPINLLANSDFGQGWNNWETFSITGTAWADLHPSSSPGNRADAAHVITTGRGGLVQVFLPYNTGPSYLASSVWVYVNSGEVGMGVGNGGDTAFDIVSQGTGYWEQLFAKNGVAPGNEFIVYGANRADFYVAQPQVADPVPEPNSLYLLATGLILATILQIFHRNHRQRSSIPVNQG